MKKAGRLWVSGCIGMLFLMAVSSAFAQTAGMVDDFDGGADPTFAGSYAVYGEDNLGSDASQLTTDQAYSATHARFLEQTLGGGQSWGIVLIKTFSSVVDASAYEGGTLDVWFYSDSNNSTLTLDVNLVFEVADGDDGISDYSLKTAAEPALSTAYGQWTRLSIPLTDGSFDVENFGAFDLAHLREIKFLIKNNGQSSPAAKVYLDDIRFEETTDSQPPTVTYTSPDTSGHVFATATPAISGLLSDDSGVNTATFAISLNGVPQSGALVVPESFSYTPASPLSEAVAYTSVVTVSDLVGNTRTAVTVFSVNSALPAPTALVNPGLEYGDGNTQIANWGKFGESYHDSSDPYNGSYHVKLVGNYPGNGSQNYSGIFQLLDAEPGDTWDAGVQAEVAEALGTGNEAMLQLIFVDGSGTTVPGGVNNSAILSNTTPVGAYTDLTVSGQAPAGTEQVKVVLLLIQRNDSAGAVNFDAVTLERQTPPSGPALPADVLVDDFSSTALYHSQNANDLGYYTDDDSTLATESCADGVLTAQWTGDAYWYTLLAPTDGASSLTNNTYLSMRYRGHAGTETFDITLREAGDMTATITCDPITDTQQHTVNYPLSDFEDQVLNMQNIRTLSLAFAGATPGTISIDGIGLSTYRHPDTVSITSPSMVTGSVPFPVEITVSDADGVITDFGGELQLAVSEGTVAPATVSGFVNGTATVNVMVDGALTTTLYAADSLGAMDSVQLTVDTVMPPPSVDNPGFENGEGPVPDDWGSFGVAVRDTEDPHNGFWHAELTGNNPGDGSRNYSGFYQILPAEAGDTWEASVYAQVGEALGSGNEALLQMIYVDGAGVTVPGGVNDSAVVLDETTPVGVYTQLTASGRAPAGTEGVKMVLLFIQCNDSAGTVHFDDASLVENTPTAPALAADVLVDDFSSTALYHSQNANDLGYYTDDDSTLDAESCADGVLMAAWTNDAYWYTLLSEGDSASSLTNNTYLSMRCRGHAGGETFTITLREADSFFMSITNDPITDTAQHTVNYPLSLFADQGINLDYVRTLSLAFAGATPGTISIDGIGLSTYRHPDTVSITSPSMVTGSVPFPVEITVSDAGGVITDFTGGLQLSVNDGTVTPATVSGFVNGTATVNVMVDGALTTTLYAADSLGAMDSVQLTVDTVLPPPSIDNPGFEQGEGPVPDDWGSFGVAVRDTEDPHNGSWHAELTGNNPGDGSRNYSGFYQTLPAEPGQTWQATAYAQVGEALGSGNEALLQMIYVDGAGVTVPGGVNNSAVVLNETTPVGGYTQLTASGRAPAGTEGVKMVLLFIQCNDSAGTVHFDDTELSETTPVGHVLPPNIVVDNFDNEQQYRGLENDLGYYTDDDATMTNEFVSNDVLTLEWDADSYWYTLLATNDASARLDNNTYLSMRYQGHSGSEAFEIKISELDGFSVTHPCQSITDTNMHTVNYLLSDYEVEGLNSKSVQTISLLFAGATPGTLSIDAIALTAHRQPDTIQITDPGLVTGGVPFTVTVTVSDAQGLVTNYDGTLELAVSAGTISPTSVSGFENGSLTTELTVDGAVNRTLYMADMMGAQAAIDIEAAAAPPVPQHLLSSVSPSGIELNWEPSEGATAYRVYRRDDELNPEASDLVATVNGPMADQYSDTTADPIHPYIYRVTAINSHGESGYSGPAMGTRYTQDWSPAPQTHGGLACLSRVVDGRLLLHTEAGDMPFVAGVNVGATTPGHSPGEVEISREDYQRWFSQIAGLGFRLIRIYTLHMPRFYEELRDYNLANPDAPLYLQHGVWLIEEHRFVQTGDLFDAEVMQSFRDEIDDVIAAVHGELVREQMPGRAYGTYTADVSPWLMNYIVGIEMEPHAVHDSDELNAWRPAYSGTYFQSAPAASPTEKWYAEMFDYAAANLAARGQCTPLAHGNWPTTDPLEHPDEPIAEEDLVGVDVNHVVPTAAWPAGRFANYHIYPYYPDAVRFEDGITNFMYKGHVDNYAGYINKIVQHHATAGVPVVISEYGVPSSMGNAHFGPLGRDQGGHSEQQQMQIDRDLLDILRNVGCSGASVFMWLDEWFKTTWNVMDIHKPTDRRWFWRNPWCNEANFGIVAAEAGTRQRIVIDGDDSEWDDDESQVIYSGAGDVQEVRATHDEAYLYLRVETSDPEVWVNDELLLGFDVLGAGNQGLPGHPGLDTNAEYAIRFGPSPSEPTAQAYLATWNDLITIEYGMNVNPPYFPVDPAAVVEGSGSWTQQLLIVSRRLTNTAHQIMPEYHNVGHMRFGTTDPQDPDFDQRTTWSAEGRVIEMRVPYSQIGYGDPSTHQAYRVQPDGSVALEEAPDIGISVVYDNQEFITDGYAWAGWNEVEWHERLKADIEVYAQAVVDVHHNHAPSIDSVPVDRVMAGNDYTYDVDANDPNALELLSYALLQAPAGMTIDATNGIIQWETAADVLGDHSVEVQVTDALGLTDTQLFTLEVTHYTMHLAYDPDTGVDTFPQAMAAQSNYTAAASIWMTAEYLFGDEYSYSQADIYGLTSHDPDHNDEITPLSYAGHLNGIDFPNYYFSARTRTNLNEAICEAIYWIDFLPLGGMHAPSAMLSGTNWAYKLIRGFQTDEKPYRAGAASTDMTVFGVWVNDPLMGGLGHNIFVPANGFDEVFLPSEADGNYHLVAEPPTGEEFDQYMDSMNQKEIIMHPPKTSTAMADALNDLIQGQSGPSMQDTRALQGTRDGGAPGDDTDLHQLLADVLPDTLLDDPAFVAAFDAATLMRSYVVNPDTPSGTYVLLVGAYRGPASTAYVAKMNPDDGSVEQMAWGNTSRYLPVDQDAAAWKACRQMSEPDAVLLNAKLVYAAGVCSSPFLPRWKLDFQIDGEPDQTVYVGQGVDLSGDQDGDGIDDGSELYAGTDPLNSSSLLELSGQSLEAAGTDEVIIEWASEADKTYSVSRAVNLLSGFELETTGIQATPPVNSYTTVPPASISFYRVEVD
jgi:hypothetical protein